MFFALKYGTPMKQDKKTTPLIIISFDNNRMATKSTNTVKM
jgi:hypothetical protein